MDTFPRARQESSKLSMRGCVCPYSVLVGRCCSCSPLQYNNVDAHSSARMSRIAPRKCEVSPSRLPRPGSNCRETLGLLTIWLMSKPKRADQSTLLSSRRIQAREVGMLTKFYALIRCCLPQFIFFYSVKEMTFRNVGEGAKIPAKHHFHRKRSNGMAPISVHLISSYTDFRINFAKS